MARRADRPMGDDDTRTSCASPRRWSAARTGTGAFIHLDIEPEPDCLHRKHGRDDRVLRAMAAAGWRPRGWPRRLGVDAGAGAAALLEHIRVCFDCCHFAVEYEDPGDGARSARGGRHPDRAGPAELGVRVHVAGRRRRERARARRAAATVRRRDLSAPGDRAPNGGALRHFRGSATKRSRDAAPARRPEWRIHFHVPLFTADYDGLGSTQDYVRTVLDAAARRAVHEPSRDRDVHMGRAARRAEGRSARVDRREYEWVLDARPAAR